MSLPTIEDLAKANIEVKALIEPFLVRGIAVAVQSGLDKFKIETFNVNQKVETVYEFQAATEQENTAS